MKFIVDNGLSPILAARLRSVGYDAVHVRDYNMATAKDHAIMARALRKNRIVISSDTDFGTLLALSNATGPSVILVRKDFPDDPDEQADALIENLPLYKHDLDSGCVLILDGIRGRVRALPMFGFSNN